MTYSKQTAWSNARAYAARLADLPAEPATFTRALENFISHHAAARTLNIAMPEYSKFDRNLRTVERLLKTAVERDDRPFCERRKPKNYLYGTCHDFSLLAVSRLRSQGIKARMRTGVVDYLEPGCWEDHWLCEYFTGNEWRLLDPQLGSRAQERFEIDFDISNVPRKKFLSASQLWRGIRAGSIDPAKCGVSFVGVYGEWYAASNLLRDAAALCAIETMPGDFWGPARRFCRSGKVNNEFLADLDALAETFVDPPPSLDEAKSRITRFDWALPGDTVLSYVDGDLIECAIA